MAADYVSVGTAGAPGVLWALVLASHFTGSASSGEGRLLLSSTLLSSRVYLAAILLTRPCVGQGEMSAHFDLLLLHA